jgi:hypothetical protein
VTCTLPAVKKGKQGNKRKPRTVRCSVKLASGKTATVSVRLTKGSKLVATGSGKLRKGRGSLSLASTRTVKAARYTLWLSLGTSGTPVVLTQPFVVR